MSEVQNKTPQNEEVNSQTPVSVEITRKNRQI